MYSQMPRNPRNLLPLPGHPHPRPSLGAILESLTRESLRRYLARTPSGSTRASPPPLPRMRRPVSTVLPTKRRR